VYISLTITFYKRVDLYLEWLVEVLFLEEDGVPIDIDEQNEEQTEDVFLDDTEEREEVNRVPEDILRMAREVIGNRDISELLNNPDKLSMIEKMALAYILYDMGWKKYHIARSLNVSVATPTNWLNEYDKFKRRYDKWKLKKVMKREKEIKKKIKEVEESQHDIIGGDIEVEVPSKGEVKKALDISYAKALQRFLVPQSWFSEVASKIALVTTLFVFQLNKVPIEEIPDRILEYTKSPDKFVADVLDTLTSFVKYMEEVRDYKRVLERERELIAKERVILEALKQVRRRVNVLESLLHTTLSSVDERNKARILENWYRSGLLYSMLGIGGGLVGREEVSFEEVGGEGGSP